MYTLAEKMKTDTRTKWIRLVDICGRLIEEGDREHILSKYSLKKYCNAYSEGEGKVNIWVV